MLAGHSETDDTFGSYYVVQGWMSRSCLSRWKVLSLQNATVLYGCIGHFFASPICCTVLDRSPWWVHSTLLKLHRALCRQSCIRSTIPHSYLLSSSSSVSWKTHVVSFSNRCSLFKRTVMWGGRSRYWTHWELRVRRSRIQLNTKSQYFF